MIQQVARHGPCCLRAQWKELLSLGDAAKVEVRVEVRVVLVSLVMIWMTWTTVRMSARMD